VTEPTTPPAVPLGAGLADLAAAQAHDQVLAEIEVAADAGGERVPDRAAATAVTWALRAVGARRVFHLDARRGGLTWWLAGAVGDDGDLHAVTDTGSAAVLRDRLRRAGRAERVTVHEVADGPADPAHLEVTEGPLDAVVVEQPGPALTAGWATVVDRLRPGGVALVGGVLPGGALPAGVAGGLVRDALEDPELWATVLPLGDGWLAALKARSDLAGGATDRLW
jgi:predicted O-methyltransferase YrrM